MATNAAVQIRRAASESDYTDFAHTGPGTIAGRYLRLFWHPVYIGAKLPAGRAVPLRIMNVDYTLYRGEGGAPHLVDARCAHRGAMLHTGWVQGDDLRCFYHGWKFAPSGQCVETPAELPGFAPKIRIGGYPTHDYLGLIFVYLGEGEPPPLPRYPDFEGDGVLDVTSYTRLCNYFNNVENNVDPAHTPFTHSFSGYTDQGLVGVPEVTGHESDWGITQYGKRPNGGTRVSQHGQPTILNLKFQPADAESGWKDLIAWRVPIDDDHHIAFAVNYVHVTGAAAERYRAYMDERNARLAALPPGHEVAARVVRGELRVADILERPDYLEVQDHIAQMSQGTIADRVNEHLGRSDILIAILRRIWTREMKAMAEGRPLKQWVRTPEIRPTNGMVES